MFHVALQLFLRLRDKPVSIRQGIEFASERRCVFQVSRLLHCSQNARGYKETCDDGEFARSHWARLYRLLTRRDDTFKSRCRRAFMSYRAWVHPHCITPRSSRRQRPDSLPQTRAPDAHLPVQAPGNCETALPSSDKERPPLPRVER